jgi:sugar phosphate isomerase/epimerase
MQKRDEHIAAEELDRGAGFPETGRVRCGRAVAARAHVLDAALTQLEQDGYTAAELAVEPLHCLLGGGLHDGHVESVAQICAAHAGRLAYSVHAPAALDPRDQRDPALHRDILLSSVRLAAAIGARVLVVHYEQRSDVAAVEEQYHSAIAQAAEIAGKHGLLLGIENIEVERSDYVLEFLESLRHPSVRITYDFAHDYLAADLFGYDVRASARACAPYAAHLHLTDNFGRFNQARLGDFNLYRAIPLSDVTIRGLGDLHLPVGWATLPIRDLYGYFAERNYAGLLISEHDGAYREADREVSQALRALADRSIV